MTRLDAARLTVKSQPHLAEYKARMGGYLDSALTLLAVAADDALANLERNPKDARAKQVVTELAAAVGRIEPLVKICCPLTTSPTLAEVANG